MAARTRRDELARYAAPVAFLVALTILVLLVRAGLNGGGGSAAPSTSVSTAAPATVATSATAVTQPRPPKKQFYAIERGDTFGVVAAKFNTTVEALQALNPGVNSNSLTIGQKIRVK